MVNASAIILCTHLIAANGAAQTIDAARYGDGPYFYVSASGNDASAGTRDAPFATIQQAIDRTADFRGRCIFLREGVQVLEDHVYIIGGWSDGRSGDELVIAAYPGENAILDAQTTNQLPAIYAKEASHIKLFNLTIRNCTNMGIMAFDGNNIEIDSCIVEYCQAGIGLYGCTDFAVTNCTVREITANGIDAAGGCARGVIQNNTVYHTNKLNTDPATRTNWGNAIQARESEFILIYGNYVYENWGEGISLLLSTNCQVVGNVIRDNFSVNLYFDNASHSRAEGNFIYCTNLSAYYRFDGHGANNIQMANEIYDVSTPERFLNYDTIINNVVVGGGSAWYYGTYGGIHSAGGISQQGLKNTVVAHNTFHGCAEMLRIDADTATTNVAFINNIFSDVRDAHSNWIATTEGYTFSNNLWHACSPVVAADSLTGDPKFSNAGGYNADDYQLTLHSTARDAGVPFFVSRDYNRKVRIEPPDIGALEYQPSTFADAKKVGDAGRHQNRVHYRRVLILEDNGRLSEPVSTYDLFGRRRNGTMKRPHGFVLRELQAR